MQTQALIPNAVFAPLLGGKRSSLNTSVYRRGDFCGIKPVKLPNGRLMWPADDVNRLLAGEIAPPAEVADPTARLAAGKAAAKLKREAAVVQALTAGGVAK